MSSSPMIEYSSEAEAAPALWKQEISERVRAHRTRQQPTPTTHADSPNRRTTARAAGVAATVAERYAAALSYSEYLAQLTTPAAHTHGIPQVSLTSPATPVEGRAFEMDEPGSDTAVTFANEGSCALDPYAQENVEQVRLAEAVGIAVDGLDEVAITSPREAIPEQATFLEQVTVEPDVPIATKLIEFPRQLVAARKVRPRLAEGPLREQEAGVPSANAVASPQLRIFEADETPSHAGSIASPALAEQAPPAEWHYIQLDTPLLATATAAEAHSGFRTLADVAPINRRLMAATVDLCLVALAFLAFTVAFVAMAATPPTDSFALIAAAIVFAVLYGTYQWTFLTLSDATPGMRYARIALCTFGDENPLRRMRRRRLAATLLSAGAAGLGYAWAIFDQDRLAWHDRMSHTYQRCY